MLRKLIVSTVAIGLVFGTTLPTYAYASVPAIVKAQEETLKKFGKVIDVNDTNIVIEVPVEVDMNGKLIMEELILKLNDTKITDMAGKEVKNIKEGTYIVANHSPIMTRSIPAQTEASEIVVDFPISASKVVTIGELIEKTNKGAEYESSLAGVSLNFTEDSSIYNTFGDKVELSEIKEDSKLLVWNEFSNGNFKAIEKGVCNVSMAIVISETTSSTPSKLENIQGIGFTVDNAGENSLYIVSPYFISEEHGFIFSDIVLHTADAKVLDVLGNEISIDDIKDDTIIKYSHSAAMAMSLPPQSNASEIQVVEDVACYVKLGKLIEETEDTALFYQEGTDDPEDKILFNKNSDLFNGIGNERMSIKDLKEGQVLLSILDYEVDKSTNEVEFITEDKVYKAKYTYLLREIDESGNIIETKSDNNDITTKATDEDKKIESIVEEVEIETTDNDAQLIIDPISADRIFIKVVGEDVWARIVIAEEDIYIERDGADTLVISDSKAVRNDNGEIMLPVRKIAENFGLGVKWNDMTKEITLLKDDTFNTKGVIYENIDVSKMNEIALISSNSKEYTAFGDKKSLNTPVTIINDRGYAPIEFFEVIFEANVVLNQDNR